MTRLAIVGPTTLMGEAVRNAVASQPDPWSRIELFTTDTEQIGAVTEVAGRAALVQSMDGDAMEPFDVVVYCDREVPPQVLEALPEHCRSIFIDPHSPVDGAIQGVAGVNSEALAGASRIVSPAPGVLLLAQLLTPLRTLGDLEVTAHILLPASARGKAGLDELFHQTRDILTMSEKRHEEVFGTQLAFNILPWAASSASQGADLGIILGVHWEAHIHLSQAAVFHCCSAGIFLDLTEDPGAQELQARLLESPFVEQAENPDLLGPVATAAADQILIGRISPSSARGYWLWSCWDNLTSSANNAVALARP